MSKNQTVSSPSVQFNITPSDFCSQFKLVVANTPKLQAEVYKIRYKVYCQELGYEREEDCPNGMEQDIYDQHSIHCLLLHRKSAVYAGSVRLVLPDPHGVGMNLPFERFYGHLHLRDLPYGSFGEISRLAVTANFRKQSKQVESETRLFPLIPLGLYLAAISVGQEFNLDGAFALMQPRLARHLRRFGINYHQVGELIEFHGQRGLFHFSLQAVLSDLNPTSFNLLKALQTQVKGQLSTRDKNRQAA